MRLRIVSTLGALAALVCVTGAAQAVPAPTALGTSASGNPALEKVTYGYGYGYGYRPYYYSYYSDPYYSYYRPRYRYYRPYYSYYRPHYYYRPYYRRYYSNPYYYRRGWW